MIDLIDRVATARRQTRLRSTAFKSSESKSDAEGNLAIAGAATAAESAPAGAAEEAERSSQAKRLAKQWRREIADRRSQIHAIQNILKICRDRCRGRASFVEGGMLRGSLVERRRSRLCLCGDGRRGGCRDGRLGRLCCGLCRMLVLRRGFSFPFRIVFRSFAPR